MLAQYQERLTAIHNKLTSKQNVVSHCSSLHGDLLGLLFLRLNNGDGSSDEQLLSRVKAFYNQQNFQARRCDLTICQTSLQVHEMMQKKSDNSNNTRRSIVLANGGALVPLTLSSIGKRELTTVEEWISPELMVAHAAYTRAKKYRGNALRHLADYQELLRLLQERKDQILSSHTSSGNHSTNNLDLTYALRILTKMIIDVTWFVDACATNPEINGNDGSSHKNKRSRVSTN